MCHSSVEAGYRAMVPALPEVMYLRCEPSTRIFTVLEGENESSFSQKKEKEKMSQVDAINSIYIASSSAFNMSRLVCWNILLLR